LNAQPLPDRKGTRSSFVISFNEITERVLQQKMITEQQAKLASTAKMAALGEMASSLAHEINNPLAIIQLDADNLKYVAQKKNEIKKSIVERAADDIIATVQRITGITRGMLRFSRDEELGEGNPVQAADLVENTARLIRHKLKKIKIDLDIEGVDPSLILSGSESQLSQVLLNLLSNAADAIEGLDERWIRVEGVEWGEYIDISVTDSGQGISEEVQKKMFNPFYTTKAVDKGTGLGMSLSKGIVENHFGPAVC